MDAWPSSSCESQPRTYFIRRTLYDKTAWSSDVPRSVISNSYRKSVLLEEPVYEEGKKRPESFDEDAE